jgi:5'-3' exonuclease
MFVRQVNVENNEADDLIAYYCHIAENEKITIFSSDKDLTQLISENVSIYSPSAKQMYKNGDKIKLKEHEIPHNNILTYKVLCGDKSDNIDGIYYLGDKTLFKLFPELLEQYVTITDIITKAETLLKEDKDNTAIKNLLTGKTKTGIYGNEFFEINKKIVDLSDPLIDDEGKQMVELYYKETLDPDGRGHRNLIRMLMEDGFFKFLPKGDDAWVNFVKPFLKLTRKEKKNFNTKN